MVAWLCRTAALAANVHRLARFRLQETGFFMAPFRISRSRAALPVLVIVALLACACGILLGAVPFSPARIVTALFDSASPDAPIVRQLRLPRVLLAFGVGGSLAVSGAALQALLRNPLAEPWLLGLSGGASLGAVIAVVIGLPLGWSVAACATVGALATMALVYRISLVAGRRLDPRILLLAGVVVGAFTAAVTSALLVIADPFTFHSATIWLFGGFGRSSWNLLGHFVVAAVPPLVAIWWLSRSLDLLALGDDSAATLGADVDRTRRIVIVATSVLTAATVAAAGVIGFVGLVVPHALRGIVGPLNRSLLPAVFIAGGAFTVLADMLARTLFRPAELPVGVVTALVGVPIFAMLLRRSMR
jgi:iron complex transport system permease protein